METSGLFGFRPHLCCRFVDSVFVLAVPGILICTDLQFEGIGIFCAFLCPMPSTAFIAFLSPPGSLEGRNCLKFFAA